MSDFYTDSFTVSHTEPIDEGLCILARMIARNFLANQTVIGDCKNDCSNNRDIPDERSLP
jgi:hypothetical protein